MPTPTEIYRKSIKKQYCKYFGVDDFECTYGNESQIIKWDTIHYCFGLWQDIRQVKFYNYVVHWKINGKSFQVELYPIIKKHKVGRNIIYKIDEEKMKKEILDLIRKSYERY